MKTLRPPIFAACRPPLARECSPPAAADPPPPIALEHFAGDGRPSGYADWTPAAGPTPGTRWVDPPEHHGPRRLAGVLIVLAVSLAVWGILFAAGLLFAQFGK